MYVQTKMEIMSPRTAVGRYRDVGSGRLRSAFASARSRYSARPYLVLVTFAGLVAVILVVFLSLFFTIGQRDHLGVQRPAPLALVSSAQAPVVTFSLNGDLSSIVDPATFTLRLAQQMASALNIASSQIIILSLRSGSIIADALFAGNDAAAHAQQFVDQTKHIDSTLYSLNNSIFAQYLITEARPAQTKVVFVNSTCMVALCGSPEVLLPRNTTVPPVINSTTNSTTTPAQLPPPGTLIIESYPDRCPWSGQAFRSSCNSLQSAGYGLCTVQDDPRVTRPAGIPGLVFDLRAENALLVDEMLSAEVNEVVNEGSAPKGATVLRSTGGKGPNLLLNAVNGLPVLQFNGQSALQSSQSFANQEFTICFTGRNFGTADGFTSLLSTSGSTNTFQLGIWSVVSQGSKFFATSVNNAPGALSSLDPRSGLAMDVFCAWNGGLSFVRNNPPPEELFPSANLQWRTGFSFNGIVSGSPVAAYMDTTATDGMVIANNTQVDIQQILFYNRTLRLSERMAVEDYLATRIGSSGFHNARAPDAPRSLMQWQVRPPIVNWTAQEPFVINPFTVYDAASHLYYLFYTVWPSLNYGTGPARIAYRFGSNMTSLQFGGDALTPTGGQWDSGSVREPDVYFHAASSTWYMFYTGSTEPWIGSTSTRIGYATASTPAGPWTKHSGFVPELTYSNTDLGYGGEQLYFNDPHIHRRADGTYRLYFTIGLFAEETVMVPAYVTSPSITGPWTASASFRPIPMQVGEGFYAAPGRHADSVGTKGLKLFPVSPSGYVAIGEVRSWDTQASLGTPQLYVVSSNTSTLWTRYPVTMRGVHPDAFRLNLVPNTNNTLAVVDDNGGHLYLANSESMNVPVCV